MTPPTTDRGHAGHEDHGVIRLHEPIARELEEPRDGFEPTPMWWVFVVMALLGWGGWYLGTYSGNWRADVYDERPGVVAAPAAPAAAADPMVLGRRIYANCQACHQADGRGVEGNYPPLAGSSWVTGTPETLVRILLHGVEGAIEVNGARYNQAMPPWKHLRDEQLAAVATYVRASWGNAAPPVAAEMVRDVRAATTARSRAWTAVELRHLESGTAVAAADGR
ncbi:MAG TPA: cytochrome c [Thermoanaerobaculaceae bacterium]|nr:cytochrome c [Thermoanaerobaculaceae bacterium]HRS17227.1 cytochrome c [Thermoanaerobaculaceae bacterium]